MTTNRLRLIALLAALVVWLWRVASSKRRAITVPGVGRVQIATEGEAAYWRRYYDNLAGDTGDYLH